MRCYFAPLEGITGYVFRNAHRDFFEPADKYFSPFIVPKPNTGKQLSAKEREDLLPEHNQGLYLVPQIMTNRAEDFVKTTKALEQLGYQEVNLNLGCPSRTVVSKGRGSGFLTKPEELDRFLEEIFDELSVRISVKTRIGKDHAEEFEGLLEIFNRYPLEELIVHPRIQQDFYNGKPDMQTFGRAAEESENPVCYNGDIFCLKDYQKVVEDYPQIKSVMMGRGLLANPGLIGEIRGKERMNKNTFRLFHDRLLADYRQIFFGDKNVLFKMKEFWFYAAWMFTDSGKYAKRIRKTQKLEIYLDVIERLFAEQELKAGGGFRTM